MQIINAEILTGDPVTRVADEEGAIFSLVKMLDAELALRNYAQLPGANYEFTPYVLAWSMLYLCGARIVQTDDARLEQKAHFALGVDKEERPYLVALEREGRKFEMSDRAFALGVSTQIIFELHRVALLRASKVN